MVTLCNNCHQKFHNDSSVEVWDQHQLNKMEFGHCDRCSGKGYILEYKKIQNGICFKCRGYGYNRRLINLEELSLEGNQLTSLPNIPSSLSLFDCTENPALTCLPYFTQDNFVMFMVRTNTNITCLPKSLAQHDSLGNPIITGDTSRLLPVCTQLSGCPTAYNVSGNVHQDISTNCIADSIANGLSVQGIKMLGYIDNILRYQAYTEANGHYSFSTTTGDTMTIKMMMYYLEK